MFKQSRQLAAHANLSGCHAQLVFRRTGCVRAHKQPRLFKLFVPEICAYECTANPKIPIFDRWEHFVKWTNALDNGSTCERCADDYRVAAHQRQKYIAPHAGKFWLPRNIIPVHRVEEFLRTLAREVTRIAVNNVNLRVLFEKLDV